MHSVVRRNSLWYIHRAVTAEAESPRCQTDPAAREELKIPLLRFGMRRGPGVALGNHYGLDDVVENVISLNDVPVVRQPDDLFIADEILAKGQQRLRAPGVL